MVRVKKFDDEYRVEVGQDKPTMLLDEQHAWSLLHQLADILGAQPVSVKSQPEPSLTTKQVLDDWFGDRTELEAALKSDNWSLFNDKAINDALSSTIGQYDQLTNAALILANNVAAVMKLHGFSFDQAMMIVGVAKGGE